MRVIGTAGHVDHGKSTLVQALTGIHPDRLKEEREREMTIDLGFAWLTLPNSEDVGIVDVPGHRDFIENMLAGIGGIDAALFVIAADEGVMPQTREHLAILDLLQIQGGVVALTKVDLIDDPEWLDLVEDEISRILVGTVLEDAPLVRVSARTKEGIPTLIEHIGLALSDRPPRPDLNRPRLPIDRVFTISGFGTVVTGTLTDGTLRIGDEVQIMPGGTKGRIRGLQSHKRKEEIAVPGSRTAINISGVTVEQIKRGEVIAHPGDYKPTRRIDVRFRMLSDTNQPIKHNMQVKLFIAAAEVISRLRLLEVEELLPGEEAWLQLELSQPIIAVRGDRYILRRPSPGETLGGGSVIDPHPKGRHKRFSAATLSNLEALTRGNPEEIIMQSMLAMGAAFLHDVIVRSELNHQDAKSAIQGLLESGEILVLDGEADSADVSQLDPNTLISSNTYWTQLSNQILGEVGKYHKINPLRPGIPKEEIKSRLKLPARLFNATLRKLVADEKLVEKGPLILHPHHRIIFNASQQHKVDELMVRFSADPYSPPTIKEIITQIGDDIYAALLDLKLLIQVSPEVAFRNEDFNRMIEEIRQLLAAQGTISAGQVRDHFNTSRRYALALLEYLDMVGVTVREGDVRRLKKSAA
jgi:selenocysteine-specific elongation factor